MSKTQCKGHADQRMDRAVVIKLEDAERVLAALDAERLLAALDAAGYAVVPKEPTKEMLHSIGKNKGYDGYRGIEHSRYVWHTMLTAARSRSEP